MIKIRKYTKNDSKAVGILIAETYGKFNLDFASPEELPKLLGPFKNAHSGEAAHRQAIADILKAKMILVAEDGGEIVGVLRGRNERLHSLFVREDHHRRGIGRKLMETFERKCSTLGAKKITLLATLYAVPFYQSMGYKKSTGQRTGWSFEGRGLPFQPMKKVLMDANGRREKS